MLHKQCSWNCLCLGCMYQHCTRNMLWPLHLLHKSLPKPGCKTFRQCMACMYRQHTINMLIMMSVPWRLSICLRGRQSTMMIRQTAHNTQRARWYIRKSHSSSCNIQSDMVCGLSGRQGQHSNQHLLMCRKKRRCLTCTCRWDNRYSWLSLWSHRTYQRHRKCRMTIRWANMYPVIMKRWSWGRNYMQGGPAM